MTELKDEIEAKKVRTLVCCFIQVQYSDHSQQTYQSFLSPQKSLQNLEDASDDLMMCEDDDLLIPYQIGDVFISHSQEETQEMLEAAKVGRYPFWLWPEMNILLFSFLLPLMSFNQEEFISLILPFTTLSIV